MIRRQGTAVLFCALSLFACGGDDDSGNGGGGGGVDTGLSSSEKLSSLDGAEGKKVCESLATSFNTILSASDRKKISCTVLALPLSITANASGMLTGDVAKCDGLVAKCMNGEKISDEAPVFEVDDEFVDANECTEANATANFSSCEATVGEFEQCVNQMRSLFLAKFKLIACASIADPAKLMAEAGADIDIEAEPKCEALTTKCPDLELGTPDNIDGEESSGNDG
jgi:hypothetical protein